MRRIKQQLPQEECIKLLKQEPRGFLAVLGENEYPYSIPLNYVYEDGKIYFHTALEGFLIDSIEKYDKVSFCVLDKGEKVKDDWWYIFKSVIIFGKITRVEDEDERVRILEILGNKYFPSEEYTQKEIDKNAYRTLILKIDIRHMTGKVVKEK